MKRLLTICFLLLALTAAAYAESAPAGENALQIVGSVTQGSDVRVVRFEAQSAPEQTQTPQSTADAAAQTDWRAVAVNALLDARFEQDDFRGKPTSCVADFTKILPAAQAALEGRQLQPVLF